MDIRDDKPKDSGELEIHETLDVPEDNINSEDLDNQSTHQLEDTQDSGKSEEKKNYTEETLPP